MARKLNQQVNSAYGTPSGLQDVFPSPIVASSNPTALDIGYPIGQTWVNKVAHQVYVMSGSAGGAATWSLASPGSSDVDTINSLSPVGGDILIDGGTNITDSNAGHTVTLSLNNAITLATSVTSPLYTSTAGTDLQLNAPAGFSTVTKLGDAAGVTRFSVTDSTGAEVWGVNSVGATTPLGALVVTGALTQTAGTVNLGQDNAANAINIGGGTTSRAIGIGNSAAAHTLTLGSTNTTASTILQSGTGDLLQTSADRITLDAVGVLELNSSGAAIGIGNDADAFAINLGTGAAQRSITIGNVSGITSVNVNTGTAGSTITTTNGVFGVVTGTGAINIGADAFAKTLTLGNVTGATAVNVNSGTGACAWTTTNGSFGLVTGTGAINIGADAFAKTITLGNATGASSVIVNGGTGAMQFGANAIAHSTTIGSVTGAASTTIQSGTGDLIQTSTDAITLDAVGVLELNSSGAAIGVGTDANNFAVNIGTAGARTVTVGSGTGASSTVINSGTGAANFGTNATDHTTTIGSTTGVSATIIQAGTGKIDFASVVQELTADFIDVSGEKVTFRQSPILQSNATTGAAPTGVTGDINIVSLEKGIFMEQFILGAGQTIICPRVDTQGLNVSGDLTATEGFEYNWGAGRANSKLSFTIGTSPAFYLQWRFRVADVSGLEPCYIGFRKTQANQVAGAIANYTDFVAFGPNDGIAPGDCAISTQLNTGGLVNTDTNDAFADGSTHTLIIRVSAAGVVTFLFDGAPPTVTQAFTFDNGDVVHPFWRHEYNAVAPGAIDWVSMECGNQ